MNNYLDPWKNNKIRFKDGHVCFGPLGYIAYDKEGKLLEKKAFSSIPINSKVELCGYPVFFVSKTDKGYGTMVSVLIHPDGTQGDAYFSDGTLKTTEDCFNFYLDDLIARPN